MVRNRCLRSFVVSSVVVSVIIVSQLFLYDDSASDAATTWQQEEAVIADTGDQRDWSPRKAVETFAVICPNCTFLNRSSVNGSISANDSVLMNELFYKYLRQYVRQLNQAQVVRNLDKFDLQADSDGSLVIVIQVRRLSSNGYLLMQSSADISFI